MSSAAVLEVDPLKAIEGRITIPQAARRVGVSVATAWRWVLVGVAGVKLQTFYLGGKRFTSEDLLADFVRQRNAVAAGEQADTARPAPTTRRRQQIAAADRELAAEDDM